MSGDNLDFIRTPVSSSTNPHDTISDNDTFDEEAFPLGLGGNKNPNADKYYRYNQTPFNNDGTYRHRRPHSPVKRELGTLVKNKKSRFVFFNTDNAFQDEIKEFLHTKKMAPKPNEQRSRLKESTSVPDFKKLAKQAKAQEIAKTARYRKRDYVRDFVKADFALTKNSFPLCPHPNHCAQVELFLFYGISRPS